ncbi:MAG TPA: hypothetical protein VMB21_10345 [Candidatus Limnocylindria bacterium]|nr:hypothetical protein [Candidatus Limnocylindria bacterium]
MKWRWTWLAMVLALPLGAQSALPSLPADEVIRRFLERSQTTTNRLAAQHHMCVRRTVTEELDDFGAVKERSTKEQSVELRGEEQRVRLLKLDDRAPSAEETKREQAREAEQHRRFVERKDKPRRQGPDFVDEKLIRRFHYESHSVQLVNGRPAYVLAFSPTVDQQAKENADRALNLLVGRIWIDAEEFELVKVEAHLKEPLTVLGGIVAKVERLDFVVERRRMADGLWFNTRLSTRAEGRRLFTSFHIRSDIQQADFRPLPEP